MNQFNWDQAFTLDFDLNNGLSKHADTTKRYLSQMKNMYQDQEAVEEILKHEDPLIYEFYELGCPERAGDLAFGTTMIHPGKIGNEYYMTKGHFHQIVDTAEVYYTLKGEGYMMLESLDGDWRVERMEKGKALYVPRGYAHRTINTGDEVLTAFYVFDADAGHDYGTGNHLPTPASGRRPGLSDRPGQCPHAGGGAKDDRIFRRKRIPGIRSRRDGI